jgi:hypothetical protein
VVVYETVMEACKCDQAVETTTGELLLESVKAFISIFQAGGLAHSLNGVLPQGVSA